MKNTTTPNYAGIDVSKSKLDVHLRDWPEPGVYENTSAGLRALLRALPPGTQIICEASGGYERALRDAAFAAGVPVSVVNARQPRDFARALGRLAKTDAIDARTLTLFGEAIHPVPDSAPSPTMAALLAASRRRGVLVDQLAREKTAPGKASDALIKTDIKTGIRQLQKRIAKFDAKISELVTCEPELKSKRERIEQIKGVGPVASATVLAECPELGTMSDKQASSLAELAPFNRDSGAWRGTRTISGGRERLRRA